MSAPPAILKGRIRGTTIELEQAPGLPDGQRVTVTIEVASQSRDAGDDGREALQRAAGTWADDPEGLDRFLEWNREQRKQNQRALPE